MREEVREGRGGDGKGGEERGKTQNEDVEIAVKGSGETSENITGIEKKTL